MVHLLTPQPEVWVCDKGCGLRDRTRAGLPNRFHKCLALGGLTTPLVPEGSGARVLVQVREDYVGNEIVQYDGQGRPVTALVTERPDGSNDVTVMAPTARMFVEE